MSLSASDIVQTIIEKAFTKNASDIHIDPTETTTQVRYRIDGRLHNEQDIPKHVHGDVIGRIKVLSQLRTDEHHTPQDGRFRIEINQNTSIDMRVSIVPSYFGESVVLRLLRDTASVPTLSDLGMSESDQKKVIKFLTKSSGMILVTGPTGSGKTTTLYTILKMLNTGKRSLITIEDPIEYSVPGIRQIQTNAQRGLTFAQGLRSIVRQDPDIIMVGEIRDAETAYIAIQTALTGHLLLSTLHTNDAATAIPRLIDMGIDPYLVSSTIGIVISQRLVRRACPHCNQGCESCHGEGYLGRIGIFEVLTADEYLRTAIMQRASSQTIRALAAQHGMTSMESDGLDKVEKGITRIDEVVAAILD